MNHYFLSRTPLILYRSKKALFPVTYHHHRRYISDNIIHKDRRMAGCKTIEEAFQQGKLYTDEERYTFLKLPVASIATASDAIAKCRSPTAFRGLLYDKDEITMMIPESDYNSQKATLFVQQETDGENNDAAVEVGSYPYRLITFDVVLDPNLIGFMHAVTKVLAAEDISVLPFAAYSRDHIFVQEKDFEKAMRALERLKTNNA